MNPFQHVDYCGVEFVLRHKCSDGRWAAYDSVMNPVKLDASFCVPLGPCATWQGEPVTHPMYFRETQKDELFATLYPDMVADIQKGKINGGLTDDAGVRWEWDIDKLEFQSSDGPEAMRVMTPGGWWL